MKVCVVASTKGGVGKSIVVGIGAERLLAEGVPVWLLDLDPQNDQKEIYTSLNGIYGNQVKLINLNDLRGMNSREDVESATMDVIDSARREEGVMLIDVQGSNNNLFQTAISEGDCVVVPMVDSPNELKGTVSTIVAMKNAERRLKRNLNVHFFWNKAKGIGLSKDGMDAESELKENGFSLLPANLLERSEYKYLPATGKLIKKGAKAPEQKVINEANNWIETVVSMMTGA